MLLFTIPMKKNCFENVIELSLTNTFLIDPN